MRQALEQAKNAFKHGEIPVGAVIVSRRRQKIIATGHNLVETKRNPTLHAEMVAINAACEVLQSKNLSSCDIYVSLEPCTMCASAIAQSRFGRLFYGANDPKQGGVEKGARVFSLSTCFHRPEIYGGLLAEESRDLMQSFFQKIREQ